MSHRRIQVKEEKVASIRLILWLNQMQTLFILNEGVKMKPKARKKTKEEREMEILMKKVKKKTPKLPSSGRYQDPTTLRNDEGVEDALDLFREMKRREF
jgi:hypothetical protein